MSDWTSVGIDISARTAEVQIRNRQGQIRCEAASNDPQGHQRLLRILTQREGQIRVCLESTGVYGIDLAVTLARHPRIRLGVLNPRTAKEFARALGQRSKTDAIDAGALCEYAERMDFEPWQPPSKSSMQLRALGRRLHQLTQMLVQEKNRLHAAESTEELVILREPIQRSIRTLETEIQELQQLAGNVIESDAELAQAAGHLCSIRGVAKNSALMILGEVAVLPEDMTNRQWVAHAGLDPRHHESGTSVLKRPRISRQGNKYLRSALYMPAHNAIQFEPGVRRFYDRLVERGKKKLQAKVAVMRKLLHAIHAMLRYGKDFDGDRFTPRMDGASAA